MEDAATPYTRGSTAVTSILYASEMGYPVHAGIDLADMGRCCRLLWLPRTRGDRPQMVGLVSTSSVATPYTRGSTSDIQRAVRDYLGYPVHAGIDPISTV